MKSKKYFLIFIFLLTSCSYFKNNYELSEYVFVRSVPEEAEVFSDTGEMLGVTPLKISKDKLGSIQKNSIVALSLKKLNYMDKQLIFKNLGVSEVNASLNKLDEQTTKKLIGGPLSRDVNDVVKKMIQVQEGIITKQFATSEEILAQLIKDYPNIASFYVMEAAVDIQNKKYEHAKIILEKSLMLDSTSELAKSYLNFINLRLNHE